MSSVIVHYAPMKIPCEFYQKYVKVLWFFKRKKTFTRLLDDVRVMFEHRGKKYDLIAKEGYEWDGASIPSIVWPLTGSSHTGPHFNMSLFHDLIYDTHILSKSVADDLFGAGIRFLDGFGYEKEIAVELFGGSAWRKSKKHINKMLKYAELNIIEDQMGSAHSIDYSRFSGLKDFEKTQQDTRFY